jgi:hypothetical protein
MDQRAGNWNSKSIEMGRYIVEAENFIVGNEPDRIKAVARNNCAKDLRLKYVRCSVLYSIQYRPSIWRDQLSSEGVTIASKPPDLKGRVQITQ